MWVYPKHPCTQLSCWQGFAVGHTRRYPLKHRFDNTNNVADLCRQYQCKS